MHKRSDRSNPMTNTNYSLF